ncbi:anti-sigma factor [Neobacillus niacini]|uniref:anti-sigma factor n=1 Tax=Neobacillus niacini TaxID=86668 RepID=UPI0021CAEC51|nr:anti-sigma factor [Neobacillus niacini]MCM3766406.1 anti-sigma factor [Neobacillus niacini]
MSNEFKRKLEAYEKGELSDSELEDFEKELEKLEKYQEFLEENNTEQMKDFNINEKRQQKILKRSKWKARMQTAFFALGVVLVFTFVSSILTAVYYSWGKPDRVDVFRNIIDYTLTVTDPYGYLGRTSTNSSPYFSLNARRDLFKKVGDETIKVGELKNKFIFSMMSYPESIYFGKSSEAQPTFSYPKVGEHHMMSDWNRLEKLSEGTVVSAFVSFADLIETKKVFQLFEGKEMDVIWFAVDTGFEGKHEGVIDEPIGFPSFPIWHDDDMILDSREVKKGLFGSRIISEGHSSPEYNVGDQKVLHKQFLKTLSFLKDHERKANNLYFGKLDLSERIDFLERNGIKHYGVVITGPTKEILKLREEPWVGELKVDEVSFWNWDR